MTQTMKILELIWMGLIPTMMMAMKNNNPTMLCLTLIILTTLIGACAGSLLNNWVMYSVILIFLGGMMIVFIYVSSLTSEEKLLWVKFNTMKSQAIFPLLLMLIWSHNMGLKPLNNYVFQLYASSVLIVLFLIIFLLLTLFLVVKLTESFKGTLIKLM